MRHPSAGLQRPWPQSLHSPSLGMRPSPIAAVTLGEYEIALRTWETSERMVLIESTEEDHLKTLFFFEIQGDLCKRAMMIGALRGLIGSFCLYKCDIEEMTGAIRRELDGFDKDNAAKTDTSFLILRIDSQKMTYCGVSWPQPFLPKTRLEDLNAESKKESKGTIDLKAGEVCYLIPTMKRAVCGENSMFFNELLESIRHPSRETALKLIESNTNVFFCAPVACIKKR